MKVLGINGSARKDGNTAIIMKLVFSELEKRGIETELIQLSGRSIVPCTGCFHCRGKQACANNKDDFCECLEKVINSDGLLLGSPVYSADVSATMKAFLERAGVVAAGNPGLLRHKVGASVAAVRRGGGLTAIDTMNHFLLNKEVIVAGASYWNIVYGKEIGDVYNDMEGIQNMHNLGENMAWLLKKIGK